MVSDRSNGGHWRYVLAAFGWLILCGAQPPQKQTSGPASTQQAAPMPNPWPAPIPTALPKPPPKFAPYPGFDPDPCYKAQDYDAANLCAQWRSAVAAEKAALEARRSSNWSIVAAFLSAISLTAVAAALYLTVESNGIFRNGQRAWISIEVKPKLVKSHGIDGLYFMIDVFSSNIGGTSATHCEIFSTIIFKQQFNGHELITDAIENMLNEWKSEYGAGFESVIAPNDHIVSYIWGAYEPPDLNWWKTILGGAQAQPVIAVCAFYRTIDKPSIVQMTWRTWYLSEIEGDGSPLTFISKRAEPLDAPKLCTNPFHTVSAHTSYPVPRNCSVSQTTQS